jgi:peptidyl-prolyl cis-trans isomerase-like 4
MSTCFLCCSLHIQVIRDWKTKASLCYAFIEYESADDCERAYMKMDNVCELWIDGSFSCEPGRLIFLFLSTTFVCVQALIDDRRIRVDFSQSVSKLWNQYHRGDRSMINKASADEAGSGGRFQLKSAARTSKLSDEDAMLFAHSDVLPPSVGTSSRGGGGGGVPPDAAARAKAVAASVGQKMSHGAVRDSGGSGSQGSNRDDHSGHSSFRDGSIGASRGGASGSAGTGKHDARAASSARRSRSRSPPRGSSHSGGHNSRSDRDSRRSRSRERNRDRDRHRDRRSRSRSRSRDRRRR